VGAGRGGGDALPPPDGIYRINIYANNDIICKIIGMAEETHYPHLTVSTVLIYNNNNNNNMMCIF
jgi:hypothetical protein